MVRHICLVLIPIDDFTNRMIREDLIKPWVDGEKPPIYKEGFYIFTDMVEKEFTIRIGSVLYQSQTIVVQLMDKETKIIKVRLVPAERYPSRKPAVAVSGKGIKGDSVFIYTRESKKFYKLSRDYRRGENIEISHEEDLDLSGKKVLIVNKGNEFVLRLGEKSVTDDGYEVETLQESLFRGETKIYLIYEAEVREDGTFYILLPSEGKAPVGGILSYREKKIEVTLDCEKENCFCLV